MEATFAPIGPTTGVEVTGLTGTELVDPGVAARCQQALHERGVNGGRVTG